MVTPVIAIVFDFDGTLGPDTISFFLQKQGIASEIFWKELDEMVEDGWDPPLAYMNKIQQLAASGKIDASKKNLQKLGAELALFSGLPGAISELKQFVQDNIDLRNAGISLEFYIISGGLEEMIRGTRLAQDLNGIFGCNFSYESSDQPTGIKSTITFTEKTRYLYGIRKGISVSDLRNNP